VPTVETELGVNRRVHPDDGNFAAFILAVQVLVLALALRASSVTRKEAKA
jgi:hypothetical protein